MTIEITFLGTGTSQGIPLIACDCPVCRSDDPRDRRTRTSAVVTLDGFNILIDASPELRIQCLENDIRRIDACLITHTHADHIFGLDDLRRFNQMQGAPIPVYTSIHHRRRLDKIFSYAQADKVANNPDLPQLIFHTLEPDSTIFLFGYKVQTFCLPHGNDLVLGYRFGPLAYCTDVSGIPDDAIDRLQGLDTLVLGALRPKPHPKHLSIEQAVDLALRIGARQTWFVHMSHQVNHHNQDKLLPDSIHLAYDGLKVTLPCPAGAAR